MIIKKEFLDIKKMSFEKALEELEKITNDFEEGSPKLDQAVTEYERGIALKEHCEKKLEEAKKSAADVIGSDDLINNISAGKINFEKLVSTPKMMIKLGKLGKILGPKGLMPNPKLGTVTNEIIKSVKDIKSGQLEIKNDKDGNIALSIGNKSFSDENLIKNFNAVLDIISKEKPSGVKGNFVKSAFVTSTMGISYKLKLNKSI